MNTKLETLKRVIIDEITDKIEEIVVFEDRITLLEELRAELADLVFDVQEEIDQSAEEEEDDEIEYDEDED